MKQLVVSFYCVNKENNKHYFYDQKFNGLDHHSNMLNATRCMLTYKPKKNYEVETISIEVNEVLV